MPVDTANIQSMSNETDITPRRRVERVVWEFGGATQMARLLGVHPSAVWQWQAKDTIPSKRQGEILSLAEDIGLKVEAKDLIG